MHIESISVVLPVYNEQGNIHEVIRMVYNTLCSLTDDFEIIAVNDGSTDRTSEILKDLKYSGVYLKVIQHTKNKGYGAALVSGFRIAKKELILMMDADQQFNISEVTKFIPYIGSHDIVAGFRIKRQDPLFRYFLGKCFSFIIKLLFKINMRDINCGFKLFRADLLHNMHLTVKGSLISTEIIALAQKNKLKIKEIGVTHYPRISGKPTGANFKVILRAILGILRLKIKLYLMN